MQLLVFATTGTAPPEKSVIAFVPDAQTISLPAHPHALEWRYHSTISDRDPLFLMEGPVAARAIALQGFFIADQRSAVR